MKGVAFSSCHLESITLFRFLCSQDAALADTSTDNAALWWCWIWQMHSRIHFEFKQLWELINLFLFFMWTGFYSSPESIPAWDPRARKALIACRSTMGCVCALMHSVYWGQMTWMVKWCSSSECTQKGGSLFITKGFGNRWEDVREIHQSAPSLAQRSVPPTPQPESLLHFLICSSQRCARGAFCLQLFAVVHTSNPCGR